MLTFFYVYLGFILLLVLIYTKLFFDFKKILPHLSNIIEESNYMFMINFYKHKNDIYKFEDSLDILFKDKIRFLSLKGYKIIDFAIYFDKILSNMRYFEELINQKMFNFDRLSSFKDEFIIGVRMSHILDILRMSIGILSFGILFIVLPYQKSI